MISRRRALNIQRTTISKPPPRTKWRRSILCVTLVAILEILFNTYFEVNHYDTSSSNLLQVRPSSPNKSGSIVVQGSHDNWCDRVKKARADLSALLHIQVPCETMKPAKSAVVCMLTDGSTEEKASQIVFTATNYIHGAMALGASLQNKIDHAQTHQLLLVRDGFTIDPKDILRLESVGWIIGTAPIVPLQKKYLPLFPRYKTTYTKISAIGLSEYDCVMLMDADTLAVGDLKDILSCNIFTEPQHRVGGTLDLYRGYWHFFNTGSILWRTSAKEMGRVFNLTNDGSFMKKFSSDQDFLNNVYPERLNNTANREILEGKYKYKPGGQVVDMGWGYNAQTHVEVVQSEWWELHRSEVRILHFTEKKGWQCEETHVSPPPMAEMPKPCKKEIPICFCREANLYWDALNEAQKQAGQAIALAREQGKSKQ